METELHGKYLPVAEPATFYPSSKTSKYILSMNSINTAQQPTPSLTTVEETTPIQPANLAASQLEAPKLDLKILNAMKHEEVAQGPPAAPAVIAKEIEKINEALVEETEPLSDEESAEFTTLTAIVQKGIDDSLLANQALREIRDRGLYRGSHKTFQNFCDEVLDMSEQRVSQILKCAEEIAKLQEEEEVPEAHIPFTERAIRELRRVKNPKNKAEVLRIAAELAGEGRPTSASILKARIKIEGEPEDKLKEKIVKIQEVLKAALLVKEFVESNELDELKVKEKRELELMVTVMAKHTIGPVVQAA